MGQTFTDKLFLGSLATKPAISSVVGVPVAAGNAGDLALSDNGTLYVYDGLAWVATQDALPALADGEIYIGVSGLPPVAASITGGGGISATGSAGSIILGSTAGGDLSGSVDTATVVGLQGTPVSATAPTDGQVLKYDLGAGVWAPATDSAAPASPVNSVQYNGAGSFAGAASFTYGAVANQLYLSNTANATTLRVDNTNTTEEINVQPNQIQITDSGGATNTYTQQGLSSSTALAFTSATDTTLNATAGVINLNMAVNKELQIRGASGTSGQVLTSSGAGAAPTWTTPTPGGTAAGAAGEIQYSDGSGGFVASDGLYWDTASNDFYVYGNPANYDQYLRLESLELNVVDITDTDNKMTAVYGRQQLEFTWDKQSTFEGYFGTIGFDTLLAVPDPSALIIRAFDNQGAYGSYNYWNMTLEARHLNLVIQQIQGVPGGSADLQINGDPGTSGQVFTSNGPNVPPTWTTPSSTPAGADTQVQFNSGGTAFGASANFTFVTGTDTLTISDGAGNETNIAPGSITPATGNNLTIGAAGGSILDLVGSEIYINNQAGSPNEVLTAPASAGSPPTWELAANVAGNLGLAHTLAATPTSADLDTYPLFNATGAGPFNLTNAPTSDGRQITIVNTSGDSSTVTNGTVSRTMSEDGGQTWVWNLAEARWFCTANV